MGKGKRDRKSDEESRHDPAAALRRIEGVGAMRAMDLLAMGLDTPRAVAEATPDTLMGLRRIGETRAETLIAAARAVIAEDKETRDDAARKAAKKRLKKAQKKGERLPRVLSDRDPVEKPDKKGRKKKRKKTDQV